MGGFLLIGKDFKRTGDRNKALGVFSAKGLALGKAVSTPDFDLHVFQKRSHSVENFLSCNEDEFVCATGTLVYRNEMGRGALESLFQDFANDELLIEELSGEYFLLIRQQGRTTAMLSPSGLYHVYQSLDGNIISSSFLAVRRAMGNVHLGQQEFFEYILNGTVYGNRTLFDEIFLMDCRSVHRVPGTEKISMERSEGTDLAKVGFHGAAEKVSQDLLNYFETVRGVFGNDICSALSGGYDSRLILGLLRRNKIDPYLYVYGGANSPDVRIAKIISDGEGLTLHHTDRAQVPVLAPDEYQTMMRDQYFICDGMTNTGIFDNGQELATRMERVRHARLQLNGGGGEIYRNFWVLPDRSYTVENFLKSKYDQFDYSPFRACFNKKEYFQHLAEKVRFSAEVSSHRLSRKQIAYLYASFRLRYWMGMNNSHNAQFANSLTPFGEDSLVRDSLSIPVEWKNEGRFEAELIRNVDNKLAAYPSCYGFDFISPPNWKRVLKGYAMRHVPIFLRPVIRRRVHKKSREGSEALPYFLKQDFLADVGLGSGRAIDEYLHLDQIGSPETLSRILSVELLIRDDFLDK